MARKQHSEPKEPSQIGTGAARRVGPDLEVVAVHLPLERVYAPDHEAVLAALRAVLRLPPTAPPTGRDWA